MGCIPGNLESGVIRCAFNEGLICDSAHMGGFSVLVVGAQLVPSCCATSGRMTLQQYHCDKAAKGMKGLKVFVSRNK